MGEGLSLVKSRQEAALTQIILSGHSNNSRPVMAVMTVAVELGQIQGFLKLWFEENNYYKKILGQ